MIIVDDGSPDDTWDKVRKRPPERTAAIDSTLRQGALRQCWQQWWQQRHQQHSIRSSLTPPAASPCAIGPHLPWSLPPRPPKPPPRVHHSTGERPSRGAPDRPCPPRAQGQRRTGGRPQRWANVCPRQLAVHVGQRRPSGQGLPPTGGGGDARCAAQGLCVLVESARAPCEHPRPCGRKLLPDLP